MLLKKIKFLLKNFVKFLKNYEANHLIVEDRLSVLERKIDSLALINCVDRVDNKKEKNIVFVLHNLNSWYSLLDLYNELNGRDNIVLYIFVAEKNKSSYVCSKYLDEEGISYINVGNFSMEQCYSLLYSINPSCIFRQSPWDNDLDEKFSAVNISNFKIVYVPYFSLNLVEFYNKNINMQVNQNLHLLAWKIYCESQVSYLEFSKFYYGDISKVKYFGNNKLNYINNYFKDKDKDKDKKLKSSEKLNILWAPHHSVDNKWLGFGTFDINFFDFLNFAQKFKDKVEIVLRPHPLLFENMSLVDKERLDVFLDSWGKLPNTTIDMDWDYLKLFEWSDLLVTDGISFLAEYPLTRKNLIFIENKHHLPFNINGKICVDCAHIAKSFEEISQFIFDVIDLKLLPKNDQINKLIDHLSLVDNVAQLIVDDILNSL